MDTVNFPFRCMACGTELQGVAVAGACSACGHPIADMLRDLSVDPASGTVSDDVPCAACGYNLRTLAANAACPECNAAVRDSLRREDIRLNSIPWLRRMCRGLTLLICAVPVFIVLIVFEERLPAFVFSWISGSTTAARLGYLAEGLAAVVAYAGILLVTQKHRGARRSRSQSLACRLARILPVVAVLLEVIVGFGGRSATPGVPSGSGSAFFVWMALTWFAFAVEMLIGICVGIRLRAIVRALGGRGLRWATTSVIWVYGFTGIVYTLQGAWYVLMIDRLNRLAAGAPAAPRPVVDWSLVVIGHVVGIGRIAEFVLLVAFVVAFVAMIECRIVIGRRLATAIARQTQDMGASIT